MDKNLLARCQCVPYVPTLGAVHPIAVSAALEGVLSANVDDVFLPYDKSRRWGQKKAEFILRDYICQIADGVIIPTITRSIQKNTIKYYCYYVSEGSSMLQSLRRQINAVYPEADEKIVYFVPNNEKAETGIFLKDIIASDIEVSEDIYDFALLPEHIRFTLPSLAEDCSDNNGFIFLWERLQAGHDDGKIFVTLIDGEIVGAVGPLMEMKDAIGQKTRFPVYFGVKKNYRRRGIGSLLWKTAIHWAVRRRLNYIILQASCNSPAEFFYQKQGLVRLGGVVRADLQPLRTKPDLIR